MNIIITGGNSYLGSRLADALIKKKYKVFLFIRSKSKTNFSKNINKNLKFCYFKSDKHISLFIKIIKPKIIIHTVCAYGNNRETYLEIFDANIRFGLLILQQIILLNRPVSFINCGTILNKFVSPYSLTKNYFSELANFLTKKCQNINFINILLHQFYGPGDNKKKFTTQVINNCYKNINFLKLTKGEQKRDFIFIDDLISAFLILVSKINNFDKNIAFEIGSGTSVSIKKFVRTVHALTFSKTKLLFGALPYRKNEMNNIKANTRIIKSLGWRPKYNLRSGISRILQQDFFK